MDASFRCLRRTARAHGALLPQGVRRGEILRHVFAVADGGEFELEATFRDDCKESVRQWTRCFAALAFFSPQQIYHLTVVTKDRNCLFLDFGAACAAARSFQDASNLKDSTMLAWVLMPDHAHWLLQLGQHDSLPSVVMRLKCASARSANRVLQRTGTVWGRAYHEHALRDERQILVVARYLVANPLRAGLVSRLGDYPFWNAIWL